MLQNDVVVVLLPWLLLLLSMDSFVVSLSLPYSILFMETTKSLQCSCIERLCLPFACFFPLLALWLAGSHQSNQLTQTCERDDLLFICSLSLPYGCQLFVKPDDDDDDDISLRCQWCLFCCCCCCYCCSIFLLFCVFQLQLLNLAAVYL